MKRKEDLGEAVHFYLRHTKCAGGGRERKKERKNGTIPRVAKTSTDN